MEGAEQCGGGVHGAGPQAGQHPAGRLHHLPGHGQAEPGDGHHQVSAGLEPRTGGDGRSHSAGHGLPLSCPPPLSGVSHSGNISQH